jgi:hypothetical protein
MLMLNLTCVRTLSLPAATIKKDHASSVATVGTCKVGLQKLETNTKGGFSRKVVYVKAPYSFHHDDTDGVRCGGYTIASVAAEEVVKDSPINTNIPSRVWPIISNCKPANMKLMQVQLDGRKQKAVQTVVGEALDSRLHESRSLLTVASGTMGHKEAPPMLLDVNDRDGVFLEEACLETTSVCPDPSSTYCDDMFSNENQYKVITFQIKSDKLTNVESSTPESSTPVSSTSSNKDMKKRTSQSGSVIESTSNNLKKRRVNSTAASASKCESIVEWNTEELKSGAGDCFYGCFMCKFTSEDENSIVKHWIKEHMINQPYVCSYCYAVFSQNYQAQAHIQHCHPDREVAIMLKPSTAFTNHLVITLESSDDHSLIPYDSSMKEIPRVLLEHNGLGKPVAPGSNFDCQLCGFTFASAAGLSKHERVMHAFMSSHLCYVCGETFSNISDAQRHVELFHGPASESSVEGVDGNSGNTCVFVYVCKACAYKTSDKSGMTRHIKYVHTSCRPYACPYCAYSAVECPKVRMHVAGHHPRLPLTVIKRLDVLENFQKTLKELHDKLTIVLKEDLDITERGKDKRGEGDLLKILSSSDVSLQLQLDTNDDKLSRPVPTTRNGRNRLRFSAHNLLFKGNTDLGSADD